MSSSPSSFLSLLSESARDLGQLSNSETLAARLSLDCNSTAESPWVASKGNSSKQSFEPIQVFPDLKGCDSIIFPDTVAIEVDVPVNTFEVDGNVSLSPTDAKLLSPFVQSIFGTKGDYAGIKPLEGRKGWAVQGFYISTCNMAASSVWAICQRIQKGDFVFNGRPIRLVRLDLTSNVPGAIEPSTDAYRIPGWRYKDNRNTVGDCCHSYIIREGVVETKVYDKWRYMLEVGALANTVGYNIPNVLASKQENIRAAFRHPDIQAQGFGRVETRYWNIAGMSFSEAVDIHLDAIQRLMVAHAVPTSLQDSWKLFLRQGHSQTLVAVWNTQTRELCWTLGLWVNKLTGKVCGHSGVGEDTLLHAIKHWAIGKMGINAYWVVLKDGKATQTHSGIILADMLHTAPIYPIGASGSTQASVCTSGYSWEDVGLALPFHFSSKLGKGRHIKTKGKPDQSGVDMPSAAPNSKTLESQATIERKSKAAEAKRAKRQAAAVEKAKQQVEKDRYKPIPSDYRRHLNIAKLSAIAKPICTKYAFLSDSKYPAWVVLVGAKWYKANRALGILLEKQPELPFAVDVWDSGRVFNGNKVWDVAIKPLEVD